MRKAISSRVSNFTVGDEIIINGVNVIVQRTTEKKVYVAKRTATPGHGVFSVDVYSHRFDDGFNRVERSPIEESVV